MSSRTILRRAIVQLASCWIVYGQICSNVYLLSLVCDQAYPLHISDVSKQVAFGKQLLNRMGAASIFGAGSADSTGLFMVYGSAGTTKTQIRILEENTDANGIYDFFFGAIGTTSTDSNGYFLNGSGKRFKANWATQLIEKFTKSKEDNLQFAKQLPKLTILLYGARVPNSDRTNEFAVETQMRLEQLKSLSTVKSILVGLADQEYSYLKDLATDPGLPIPWPNDLPWPITVLDASFFDVRVNRTNEFRVGSFAELLEFDIDQLFTPDLLTCVALVEAEPAIHVENSPRSMTLRVQGLLALITDSWPNGQGIYLNHENGDQTLRCLFSFGNGERGSTPAVIIDIESVSCMQPGGAAGEATIDLQWQLLRSQAKSSLIKVLPEEQDAVLVLTTGRPLRFDVVEMVENKYPNRFVLQQLLALFVLVVVLFEIRMCLCAGLTSCCYCKQRAKIESV